MALALTEAAPRIAEPYRAPAWLRGGHAQTIYPLLVAGAVPPYRRTRWETPDGDFVDLDWTAESSGHTPQAPLVVLFHGLEGSARSHYARALMRELVKREAGGVVVHFRGCSGEPNRLARAYHSGDFIEIDWILRRLRATHPHRPLFAVGVSLGGSALLNWLGRCGGAAEAILSAAAAVGTPLDLALAGRALERGFNAVYTHDFLRSMKRNALAKWQRFPDTFDRARMLAAATLHAFDDAVTAPLHGFRDADDYWQRASSRPWLGGIGIPTLVLNALNDPFVPPPSLPAQHEVSRHVLLEYPAEGGHVGFFSASSPPGLRWLPWRALEFFGMH